MTVENTSTPHFVTSYSMSFYDARQ